MLIIAAAAAAAAVGGGRLDGGSGGGGGRGGRGRGGIVEAVDGPASLAPIAVDGGLELVRRAELELVALVRIEVLHVLGAESEGGTGDRAGQVEALGDLAPQLLVDDLDEAALGHHELVELEQVEHVLGHDGYAVDGRAALLHEREQVVQKVLALHVVRQLVQLYVTHKYRHQLRIR